MVRVLWGVCIYVMSMCVRRVYDVCDVCVDPCTYTGVSLGGSTRETHLGFRPSLPVVTPNTQTSAVHLQTPDREPWFSRVRDGRSTSSGPQGEPSE